MRGGAARGGRGRKAPSPPASKSDPPVPEPPMSRPLFVLACVVALAGGLVLSGWLSGGDAPEPVDVGE